MSFILFIDRVKNKISGIYRKTVFKKKTKCGHSDFRIYGKINLINKNIKIGKNVAIYPNVTFFGDGLIELGDNVDTGDGTLIYASKSGGVSIGNNTLVAAQSYIIDCDHGIKSGELIRCQPNTVRKIEIGSDVWIAAGCKILKGAVIHNGAVIGASSVVKCEIPPGGIAVGIPARVIKYRE